MKLGAALFNYTDTHCRLVLMSTTFMKLSERYLQNIDLIFYRKMKPANPVCAAGDVVIKSLLHRYISVFLLFYHPNIMTL